MALRLEHRPLSRSKPLVTFAAKQRPKKSVPRAGTAPRLRSLDALRGFDMLWIIGADSVAKCISQVSTSHTSQGILSQFSEHSSWAGLQFYDLIFPLFIVIMGVALPHSIGQRLELSETRRSILLKIFRRTGLLFLLGLVYNGLFLFHDWDHVRVFGVLQRLALTYCVCSLLMVFTSRKFQGVVGVTLLLLYWGLLLAIPVPGFSLGDLSPQGNAANYLDRLLLMPHQMYTSLGDPEGILSTLPAVSTCLIGVFAGYWLRSDNIESRKVLGLLLAGAIFTATGLLWMPFFPIVKQIWTSSFVLTTGGLSLALIGVFYWIIEVRGWVRWAIPLVVIGLNPLLIYLLAEIVDFEGIAGYFLKGPLHSFVLYQALGIAIGALGVKWLLLYFLYRHKIFVKI